MANGDSIISQLFTGANGVGINSTTAAALLALVGTRIYPQIAPAAVNDPRIVYHRIAGRPVHSFKGNSGLTEGRFQIDIFAQTYASAKAVRDAIKANCDGFSGTISGILVGACLKEDERDIDDPQPDVELNREYGCSLDFLIIHQE